MSTISFLPTYDQLYGPRLGIRQRSFRRIFEILETKLEKNYHLLETGCARQENNWSGDGLSTILWDHFVRTHAGSVMTVDISLENCKFVQKNVSEKTSICCMDSVQFLWGYVPKQMIDMIYLDSFDLDVKNAHPSAMHHLKELTAAMRFLQPPTLIVVDDNFPGGPGKGMYVAEFMKQVGAQQVIQDYQVAWLL